MADHRDSVQLHLLRHAHAGEPTGWTGSDDERPLSAKGEEQAERPGRFLASTAFRPDVIVSSPKIRAARTAEDVGKALDPEIPLDQPVCPGPRLVARPARSPAGAQPRRGRSEVPPGTGKRGRRKNATAPRPGERHRGGKGQIRRPGRRSGPPQQSAPARRAPLTPRGRAAPPTSQRAPT